jgi:hypothetical protein
MFNKGILFVFFISEDLYFLNPIKNTVMKWFLMIGVVGLLTLWACNNSADGDAKKDSLNAPAVPNNTMNNDTPSRMGDTASYQRMSQMDSLSPH